MMVFADALIAGLLLLGGAFALIGSWGLVKLPSLMSRLHGPTKATTLGVGSCLFASVVYFPLHGQTWTAHELLIALFLFITAPISANLIAKAYLHGRRTEPEEGTGAASGGFTDMPDLPPGKADWATFGHDLEQ
ncbi:MULTISPECIES: Na+/H+ antiporter subunit G [unclassified Sphingomonas]|uniref:Na+/H+ antiporter subunit G n=1 Tax=unclassified Sphingomonas TaxID=196159 RepID=UPI001D12C82E|nr:MULTISPECIES: Na+/H+ antiporter subunit G [unclassified Sphingomonas]MCC2981335.1 Na+/H+ antiporter subunit G [Sphingomonas sp. IC4-52]MCD2317047.1 Na+/H+ antiporter subunit G [Sphingomonas sp. IC-11]